MKKVMLYLRVVSVVGAASMLLWLPTGEMAGDCCEEWWMCDSTKSSIGTCGCVFGTSCSPSITFADLSW